MKEPQYRRWNHFVPRLYLKRFTFAPKKVWEYRLLVSHENVRDWREMSIDSVGAQEYLYSYGTDTGVSDRIERWLESEFEAGVDEAIERAVRELQMTKEHWRRLARFFAAQIVRTPAFYLRRQQKWQTDLPAHMTGVMNDLREKLPYASGADFYGTVALAGEHGLFPMQYEVAPSDDPDQPNKRSLKIELTVGRKMWLYEMHVLLGGSRSMGAMEQHKWTILKAPQDEPWHTSDNPAVCIGLGPDGKRNFTGGWGAAGSVFMLPLDPNHLLYAETAVKSPDKYTVVEPQKAKEIRRILADNAMRSIFADRPYRSVSRYRVRKVDAEQYQKETQDWREWHEHHTDAERFIKESQWKQKL